MAKMSYEEYSKKMKEEKFELTGDEITEACAKILNRRPFDELKGTTQMLIMMFTSKLLRELAPWQKETTDEDKEEE